METYIKMLLLAIAAATAYSKGMLVEDLTPESLEYQYLDTSTFMVHFYTPSCGPECEELINIFLDAAAQIQQYPQLKGKIKFMKCDVTASSNSKLAKKLRVQDGNYPVIKVLDRRSKHSETYVGPRTAAAIVKRGIQVALKQENSGGDVLFVVGLIVGCVLIITCLPMKFHFLRSRYPSSISPTKSKLLMDIPFHSEIQGSSPFLCIVLIGLFLCTSISLQYNMATTTLTTDDACLGKVQTNFVPSISAVIGDHAPQRYIWKIMICLLMTNRFSDGWAQFYHVKYLLNNSPPSSSSAPSSSLSSSTKKSSNMWDMGIVMAHAKLLSFVSEQLSLILLSMVSSADNLVSASELERARTQSTHTNTQTQKHTPT
jgi:hypothetical protein